MGLNPKCVDEELVDLMDSAGMADLDVGAEAGSDVTLQSLGKNFTTDDIVRTANLLHHRRIPVTWYLLFGSPNETKETVTETLDFFREIAHPWDLVNIATGIRVYKGSPLAESLQKENPNCTKDNFLKPVAYEPKDISLSEIKFLIKEESFKRTNIFIYEDDEDMPPLAVGLYKFIVSVLRLFGNRQPGWKIFIVMRRIEAFFGIRKLKAFLHKKR